MISKKVKTAFELAMEKIDKMPKLDKVEIEKQHESELFEKSEAIIIQYFQGHLKLQKLEKEISQFNAENRPVVRKSILKQLKDAIGVIDKDKNVKALAAIQQLDSNVDLAKIQEELNRIIQKYQHQRHKEYDNLGIEEQKRLQKMGISGSAVAPNLQNSESGIKVEEKLKDQFQQKMEKIRGKLPG